MGHRLAPEAKTDIDEITACAVADKLRLDVSSVDSQRGGSGDLLGIGAHEREIRRGDASRKQFRRCHVNGIERSQRMRGGQSCGGRQHLPRNLYNRPERAIGG